MPLTPPGPDIVIDPQKRAVRSAVVHSPARAPAHSRASMQASLARGVASAAENVGGASIGRTDQSRRNPGVLPAGFAKSQELNVPPDVTLAFVASTERRLEAHDGRIECLPSPMVEAGRADIIASLSGRS